MTRESAWKESCRVGVLAAVALLGLVTGCKRVDENKVQGYIEGEFLYASSPVVCPSHRSLPHRFI